MAIRFEITGNDMDEILATIATMMPEAKSEKLENLSLQELLLYTSQRAEAEGYDMEVKRPPAIAKKEEARAKLRGDLEASVKQEEAKAEEPEEPAPAKKAAPKKTNGKAVSDADRKAQCIKTLQQLYANGRKTEVNKILADFGEGAKNFNVIPEDKFGPIHDAIEALPA